MIMVKTEIPQGALDALQTMVESGEEAILKKEHGKYVVVANKRRVVWREEDKRKEDK